LSDHERIDSSAVASYPMRGMKFNEEGITGA